MPVGFNSPARNFFLLGSTGEQIVTNFFKRIDQSTGTDGVYIPDEIRYNVPDQTFILAGTNQDSQSKNQGWFEKRSQGGSADWNVLVESTQLGVNTTLRALEIDGDDNLIVCGKTGTVPWIAKYDNDGNISWQVTSNTAGVEYTGIAVDSNNNLYACGSSSTEAFIEKVDGTGTYSWGKYSSNTAGAITFLKCAANDRGEVVAVGKIEDTVKNKGYIAKVDTSTGDLLWDRTIEDPRLGQSNSYLQTECTDIYIDDNDQIYIIGTVFDNVAGTSKGFITKYTAEGNMIWQKESPADENIQFTNVKSDTETEQTIVFGTYVNNLNNNYGMLSKYSKDGTLTWRRLLYTSFDIYFSNVNLDADPSFYYLLFIDQQEDLLNNIPDSYVFGKVSTSGNGLGNFEYSDGLGTVFYETSTIQDTIGRLSDGSVRQDSSDLLTYPFGANKILFDDLATQVANKKVQVDEAGTYSDPTYSITTGYPKISTDPIVYDSSLLLNYDFKNSSSYTYNHNLLTGSDFSTNNSLANISLSQNATIAPDGTNTAVSIDGNTGTSLKYYYKGRSTTTTGTYTTSVYAKYKSEQFIVLRVNDNSGVNGCIQRFDILNGIKDGSVGVGGTATGGSSTITAVGNGWYRLSVTVTFNSALTQIQGSQVWLTGYQNTSSTNGVYLWGPQLVFGSDILPYTKTISSVILPATTVNNLSSTSYSGTITEATFNSAGYFVFDGSNDYIEHATESFPITGDVAVSLEGWFYFTGTNVAGDYKTFFAYGNGPSAGDTIAIGLFDNFRLSASFNGGLNAQTAQNTLPTNVWKHLVVTKSPGAINTTTKIYMNGVEQTIESAPTNIPSFSSRIIRLGRWTNDGAGYYYQGRIGETRIYNRALTAAEISKNFNATRAKYGV